MAEAMAAAAWTRPYSYIRNFISDLGVRRCDGAGFCSPLAPLMNAGFILSGVLAIAAAALLIPLVRGGVMRGLLLGLAVVHGTGSITVGLIPSAPGTAAGTPHLHVLGALAAIAGGNMALIVAGLALSTASATSRFRWASIAAGTFGLVSGVGLVTTRALPPGLMERGAVDTITFWEVAAGVLLLLRLRRPREPWMA